MLVVYTSPGCASCRKVKAWLDEKGLKYIEKNLFTSLLQDNEIRFILSRTENGTDDIISKRSKIIKESNIDLDGMSTTQLIEFMRQNPSIIKRPIIINENNILVGYDAEEMDVFDQEKDYQLKNACMKESCPNFEFCGKVREETKAKD